MKMKKRMRFGALVLLLCLSLVVSLIPMRGSRDSEAASKYYKVKVIVGKKTFTAKLTKNKTTKELVEKMPFTIKMNELNGNEKYHYFSDTFTTNAKTVKKIKTGDLKLYGDNCLVLFYKNFKTSYKYTNLGKISNTKGMAKALGKGNVKVKFKLAGSSGATKATATPTSSPTATPDAVSGATETTEPSSQPAEVTATPTTTENEKTLVVYFSRAGQNYNVGVVDKGNTAIVAEKIIAKTGANSFEIVAKEPYPSGYEDCKTRATNEKNSGARPEYIGDVTDWSSYSRVFIGYPIWWGDMPMIVYGFIENHNWGGKTVIPFNTHEGSGQSGTQSIIESKCSGATVLQGLAIKGQTAQGARSSEIEELNNWLSRLGI